jgi:hypothetical protein
LLAYVCAWPFAVSAPVFAVWQSDFMVCNSVYMLY